jgi:hypothetical protein
LVKQIVYWFRKSLKETSNEIVVLILYDTSWQYSDCIQCNVYFLIVIGAIITWQAKMSWSSLVFAKATLNPSVSWYVSDMQRMLLFSSVLWLVLFFTIIRNFYTYWHKIYVKFRTIVVLRWMYGLWIYNFDS